jgi:hypothetical protein
MGTGSFEIAFELGIVVYVEMALKWNNISGIHTLSQPGQFMPFFIALAQFIRHFIALGSMRLFSRWRRITEARKVSFGSVLLETDAD